VLLHAEYTGNMTISSSDKVVHWYNRVTGTYILKVRFQTLVGVLIKTTRRQTSLCAALLERDIIVFLNYKLLLLLYPFTNKIFFQAILTF
jgi:hypothetical protein